MNSKRNRIPSLDGLRAISIALVILSHFASNFGLEIAYAVGNLGVRIFFIISGFLITLILVNEVDETSTLNLKKFYFRRTLRIFPAYYFYICVLLIFTILGLCKIPLDCFLSPITYTSNYFASGNWELGHSWSLSVEEQFYLIYPGIFLFYGISKTKNILLFIVLITPLIRIINFTILQLFVGYNIPPWFVFAFHNNMDALAVGCLLALYRSALHQHKIYQNFLQSKIIGSLFLLVH